MKTTIVYLLPVRGTPRQRRQTRQRRMQALRKALRRNKETPLPGTPRVRTAVVEYGPTAYKWLPLPVQIPAAEFCGRGR